MPEKIDITLTCEVCEKRVAGGDGYVIATWRDIREAEAAAAAWKQANPGPMIGGGALLDYPDPARWHVYHRACDPTPDEGCVIPASRAGDPVELLKRTAHLMGKDWLPHTDWDEFLYRVTA
jgi:hypothetical protein